jgi:hypothetical protein
VQIGGLTARLNRLPGYQWFVLFTLICLGVLCARESQRISSAHLWAEDGTVFLAGALGQGASSLLEPYAGYFHTVSRLMALVGIHLVDLTYYPIYTRILCLLMTALIFASFTQKAYEWLMPSVFFRGLVAILFCLVPGTSEVFGNPTNIHWILYLYLWLLALKPGSQVYSGWEMALIFLCVVSTGESLVLVPMVLWRLYQQRQLFGKLKMSQSGSDLFFLCALVGMAVINFVIREHHEREPFVGISKLLETVIVTTGTSFFYLPILGPGLYEEISAYMGKNMIKAVGLLAVFYALSHIVKQKGRAGWTFILSLGCAFGVPLLTFIVRPISIHWFGRLRLPADHFSHRYYFLLAPMGVLIWAVFAGGQKLSSLRSRIVGFFLLSMMFFGGMRFFKFPPMGSNLVWKEDVKSLISSLKLGCPKGVTIPIYPEGWQFSYSSSKTEVCP